MTTDSAVTTSTVDHSADHARSMDRMYRFTRHVYDASRRYYLFGRDTLLSRMTIRAGDRVLEMGCGTARNLIKLQRLHPHAKLFGLDASQLMLDTAALSLHRRGIQGVTLRQCLAERMDHQATFACKEKFDVIFFSYALSMMPTWKEAIDAALASLQPDGRIYIVDFWDQAGYPRWFQWVLRRWLAMFHVHHRPQLHEHLAILSQRSELTVQIEPIGRRYAFIGVIEPK